MEKNNYSTLAKYLLTIQLVIFSILSLILISLLGNALPPAVDWETAFKPAVWKLLQGQSPYLVEGYFNAPWTLLPLIPLVLLPESLSRAAHAVITLAAFAYTAYKLDAKPLAIVILLLSPPVMHGLLNGNIDWLAILGFVLPPQIGLFFITTKPQIGIAVGLYWLVDIWLQQGWRKVIQIFSPVSVALLLSFAFFGLWPLRFEREIDLWWNASLWPMSLPIGLVLLVTAIRRRKIEYAMGASPCLSPYVLLHSWVGALLAIVASLPEMIAAVFGLWLLVAIQAFG